MGYTDVEFAGYFQHKPADICRFLKDAGLSAPSGHVSPEALLRRPQAALDEAAEVGHAYVVLAWWEEPLDSPQACHKLIELLNSTGRLAQERGISLAYHNHDFEFSAVGDWVPYDQLVEETIPELVDFELDVYWAANAGRDPRELINSQPERFSLLHAKDRSASGAEVDVGHGEIDFSTLLDDAAGNCIRYVFVERDEPVKPFESARTSLLNLKRCLGG